MSEITLTCIADEYCQTGENPYWHPMERKLYWTDIPNGKLYRYDPVSHSHECCYEGRVVGGFTMQPDGSLLLFRDKGNVVTWHNGEVKQTIIEAIPDHEDTRFNDVIADVQGAVFCGSMSSDARPGRLHRLNHAGTLEDLLDEQGTPNGMGYSSDLRTMYYSDSGKSCTWAMAYDPDTSSLGSPRMFRDAEEHDDPGRPDGLTVDDEGYIWTARWDGAAVLRFDPSGKLDQRFEVPLAQRVSSLIFAPRYDEQSGQWSDELIDLYLTTAGGQDREQFGSKAGAILRMRFEGDPYRGKPEYFSRIGL